MAERGASRRSPSSILASLALLLLLMAPLVRAAGGVDVLIDPSQQLSPLVSMGLLSNSDIQNCSCECLPQLQKSTWTAGCNGSDVVSLTVSGGVASLPSNISNLWALTSLSMPNASLSGSIPSELGLLANLVSLNLSSNSLDGTLPGTLLTLTRLTSMDLHSNLLTGAVLPQLSQLSSLDDLNLGRNLFQGPILESLGSLANLTYLNTSATPWRSSPESAFNLSCSADAFAGGQVFTSLGILDMSGMTVYGRLSDFPWQSLKNLSLLNLTSVKLDTPDQTLPINLPMRPVTILYSNQTLPCPGPQCLDGSSAFCAYCPCHCALTVGQIVGIVVSAAAAIILLLALCFFLKRRKEWSDGVEVQGARRFSVAEIEAATNSFQNILGKGGFGEVYHGTLATGEVVAVKRTVASRRRSNVKNFDDSFRNEILVLSGVRHINLVHLLGYCSQGSDLLLVYEFVARGSVDDLLRAELKAAAGVGSESGAGTASESGVGAGTGAGAASGSALTWARRLVVAHGAAQGLDYLHTGVNPPIMHRDVKSSNILVDSSWVAKVADFGLSKIRPEDDDGTKVKGTPGYLDPDYLRTGRPTDKSDVYSFGVVLLELATGWRPVGDGKHITTRVARAVKSGGFESIVAASIRQDVAGALGESQGQPLESLEGAASAPPARSAVSGDQTTSSDTVGSSASGPVSGGRTPLSPVPSSTREVLEDTVVDVEGGEGVAASLVALERVAPFSMALFIQLVKLGMQCCARHPGQRPVMKSVAKALGDIMDGRGLTDEVLLSEGTMFEDDKGDDVVEISHTFGGQLGSTVAFVMESGLRTR